MDLTDASSDDVHAFIKAAQGQLAQVSQAAQVQRDPYRTIIVALSGTLGVFGKSITRWERAVADVIAARDPLPDAERNALKADLVTATEDGAYRGMRKEAQRMVRKLDSKLSVQIGLCVGGAYIAGALTLLAVLYLGHVGTFSREAQSQTAWQTIIQNNPDPRNAISSAGIQSDQNGRRYYTGLRFWIDPARLPPATP